MEQGAIRRIRIGVKGLAVAATAFCLYLMLWSGRPSDPLWWLAALFFMIWAFAPYVLLWVASRRPLSRLPAAIALLVGALLCVGIGLAIYVDGFLLASPPDAQVGLLFLFIPPWQILLTVITWATSLALERRR
ncbi:MAG: hypothetical protein R3F22_06255 [Lysobacteraceae bacterium]